MFSSAKKIILKPQHSWGSVYNGADMRYAPGDTLVILATDNWAKIGLYIENVHGTKAKPVVIINEGGQTKLGAIALHSCTHIKLTGAGGGDFYGFLSDGAFSAIDVTGRSSHIEIERWKVLNAGYICRAKQDPHCDPQFNYPNWRMDNISIHDTWSSKINQDGMYFGNTAPTSGRPIGCNGETVSPIPMRLSNVSIYNNYIESTGRTAIQISGADSGVNRIYNNTIRRTGFELNQTQGSGIIVGGMAHADVYNNHIRETFQFGILVMGSGVSRVYNNNIDSSGMLDGVSNPGYRISIACNAVYTYPLTTSRIEIKNNKVGSIDIYNIVTGKAADTWETGNVICGNYLQNGKAAVIQNNGNINYTSDCRSVQPVGQGRAAYNTDRNTGR